MNFFVYTLGCKVNTYESEYIKEDFINNGYKLVTNYYDANIIIINTCSVTNASDAKSRKIINQARRENPHAILVVAGCSAESNKETLDLMDIDILIGNKDKKIIRLLVEKYLKDKKKIRNFYDLKKISFEDMSIKNFINHTRAFVKIQDGCNNFCSYCIIPFTRGPIRSKDFNVAIEEINCLANNNYQEIVLTGIHTGTYGTNTSYDLVDLIEEISKNENIKRIRISSIEITELNDKFIECFKNNKKLCNHLHIPIQSGSDKVLKDMNRKYDIKYYKEFINKVKSIRDDVNITTDLIVGYPTETDEDFNNTIESIKEIGFSKIHIFPYSPRRGTKSSNLKEIDSKVKKDRIKNITLLSNTLENEYYSSFIGKKVSVLVENEITGFTSNYIKVILDKKCESNTFVNCVIKKVDGLNVYADVI